MPRTPDDPAKAQAWLTQNGPQVELELYVPRGNKGDPGGFNAGTELGTANLNEIMTPGLYKATLSANVTALNNYPIAGVNGTGVLRVYQQGPTPASGLLQEFVPVWGNQTGRVIFTRTYAASAWSAWRSIGSSRIDQTAGRAMYAWDELNAREQLVYGDTGWRNISSMAVGVGTLHIRRNDQMVTINAVGLNSTAGASYVTIFASGQLPGFQPSITMRSVATTAAGAARILDLTGGLEMRLFAPEAAPYSFSIAYPTNDAWPTVLPGTAVGTIPNL